MSCRQIKLRGLSVGLEDGVLQKVVQDNSSNFILGHCHYNLCHNYEGVVDLGQRSAMLAAGVRWELF